MNCRDLVEGVITSLCRLLGILGLAIGDTGSELGARGDISPWKHPPLSCPACKEGMLMAVFILNLALCNLTISRCFWFSKVFSSTVRRFEARAFAVVACAKIISRLRRFVWTEGSIIPSTNRTKVLPEDRITYTIQLSLTFQSDNKGTDDFQ